jgi:DNA-binding response OmpR family regulator
MICDRVGRNMPASFILVVDDETVITQTIVLILNSFKDEFFAIGSTNVNEALRIVEGIRPDLVLLDAIMPGAKGLDQALRMRDQYGCKVLMMSGQGATSNMLDDSIRDGNKPFEILAKPVHPNDLIAKIREMLHTTPLSSAWQNPLSFRVH